MLVLSRTRGQSVMIGDEIDVTVIDMRGDKVRLGINAPRNVAVHRREVYDAIRSQNTASAQMKAEDVPGLSPRPAQGTVAEAAPRKPESSPLFTSWKDPASGVESFILTERVAPAQESFESPASSLSADGRCLWFYCAFSPGGHPRYGRSLAVVDFHDNAVRHFPETQFGEASPLVDPQTGDVYWSSAHHVYRRSAKGTGRAALVGQLGRDALRDGQFPLSASTRLSFSADRRRLSLDAALDGKGLVGAIDVAGGAAEVWQAFEKPASHAQFNPVEPDLMLFRLDGQLHTVRKGQKAKALAKEVTRVAEAFWSADGKAVYYTAPGAGLMRVAAEGGKAETIWPAASASFHIDAAGQYIVAAVASPEPGHSRVAFYNVRAGKEARIYTLTGEAGALRARPRFTGNGEYVVYTTSAKERADVALTPVAALVAATA